MNSTSTETSSFLPTNTSSITDSSTTSAPFDYSILFGYEPNPIGALITCAIFCLLFLVVLVLSIRFRNWYVFAVPIGSAMEAIGFYFRSDYQVIWKYILTHLLILIAPTILAMASYALISKLMIKAELKPKIITPGVIRYVFLFADIAAFILQLVGSIVVGDADEATRNTGKNLLLAGLSIALGIFCFCLAIVFFVHIAVKIKKIPFTKEKFLFYALYANMLLLIIRSVYRVLEFAENLTGNEGLFYALDPIPMIILNSLWIVFHPGFWKMSKSEEVASDNNAEMIYT